MTSKLAFKVSWPDITSAPELVLCDCFSSVWGHTYLYVTGRTHPNLLGFWTQSHFLKDDQIHPRVNVGERFLHLATWPSGESRWLGLVTVSHPPSLPGPVEEPIPAWHCGKAVYAPPPHFSLLSFSVFFAIREDVSSEDTAICNIWKKTRSLLFIGIALPSHVNPCDIIWIMKVLLIAFPLIFKGVLASHWPLWKKRLIVLSNIFIDIHVKWFWNVESISLCISLALFVPFAKESLIQESRWAPFE